MGNASFPEHIALVTCPRRSAVGIARVALGCFLSSVCADSMASGQVSTGIDEDARLPYWEITDRGMTLRLVQRLPDQTRAFFMARSFTAEHAERIAQSCVFQTVFANTSHKFDPSTIDYNLHDWVVYGPHGAQAMKLREDWDMEWVRVGAGKSARVAFEWALLPTEQRYRPGDYNWGMSIFDLKPGTTFDLEVVWHQYGDVHRVKVKDIRCAPDIHIQPEGQS